MLLSLISTSAFATITRSTFKVYKSQNNDIDKITELFTKGPQLSFIEADDILFFKKNK